MSARALERLGLHRPELRAWAMYDWANSVFMTTVLQVFPIYFASVAAADLAPAVRSARFAWATSLATGVVALLGPVLGAIADYEGMKKKLLGAFLGIGVLATSALYFVERGDWRLGVALFVVGNIAINASFVFYDSLLPHIARADEMDRVSSAGYALGYLGGGLLLGLNLLWIRWPRLFGIPDAGLATRLSFLSAGVWWLAFSIPLFRRVPEPPRQIEADERPGQNPILAAFSRLAETLHELRSYRHAFLFTLAFVIYSDAINTIIRMATIFGTEMGIGQESLIGAILLVQFVGIPFSFLFGLVADRIGAKPSIAICLVVYAGISVIGYYMTTALHFFVLAFLVGTVQGGSQALSRSLFASLIPRHRSSEFFGFFTVFSKVAGVLGPAVFATMITSTGSSRPAILSIVAFFVVGGALLAKVDVAAGQRAAQEADARAVTLAPA